MNDLPIQEYFFQIWRRKWSVLSFFLATVFLVLIWTLQQQKVYRASTTVEIGSETPGDVFFNDVTQTSPYGWWSAMRYYETQYQIIQSRDLLTRAAQKAMSSGLVKEGTVEQVTAMLQGGVSVKSDENSRLAQIIFDDSDPKRAQDFSILISEVYVEENLARKLRGIDDAVEWLNARLGEVQKEKSKQMELLQQKKVENKIVSFSDQESIAKNNLRALLDTLNSLKSARLEVEAKYNKMQSLVKNSKRVEDLFGVVSSELLTKFKEELASLQSKRSGLAHRYLEKHPEMLQIDASISELNRLIQQEVDNEVSRLKTRFLLAKAEEDSISKAVEQQKLEAIKIEEISRDIEDMALLTSTNQQIYETLLKKIKEADLSSLVRSNNLRVVDRALLPGAPIKPSLGKNILLGVLLGLVGGILFAFLVEFIDDTVKSAEDIERKFEGKFISIIPKYRDPNLREGEKQKEDALYFLPMRFPSAVVSEFYRALRTNVLFVLRNPKQNKILFASTGPGEGKTVTTTNLAITFAQMGKRVVVIDLDFRKPKIHDVAQMPRGQGLTNVLLGEKTLEEVLVESTEVPNLFFITCGSIPPNPAELLSSIELKNMLDQLSADFDFVFADSSPIAPVTDAVITSQLVDGVVMLVRNRQTHKKALFEAAKQLERVKAKILGVVLNDVDLEKSTYGSYQYYKYGYQTYAEQKIKSVDVQSF